MTTPTSDPDDRERRGLEAYRQGRLAEAVEHLHAALAGYRSRADSFRAAEIANNLSVILLKSGQPRQALEALQGTAAAFEAAGDALRHAQALGNEASAREATGDLDEAERLYRAALVFFRGSGNREAEAQTWQALAALLLRRGRPLEAASSVEAGLAASPPRSGPRRWIRSVLSLLARVRPF